MLSARKLFAKAVISYLTFALAAPLLLGQASSVDVVTHLLEISGCDLPELTSSNFRLSQGGTRIPFTLQRFNPSEANTYAILDLMHCPADQGVGTVPVNQELASMFDLGWHVSVLDANGNQTPFATSSQQLATATKVSGRSEAAAVRSLNENAGLHFVFAHCVTSAAVPPRVLTASSRTLAPIFTINPGARVYRTNENQATSVQIFSNNQEIASFMSPGGLTRIRLLPRGRPLDQPNFAEALKTAQIVAKQFYLLHIQSLPSNSPLTLDVRVSENEFTKTRIFAESYSDGPQAPRVIIKK